MSVHVFRQSLPASAVSMMQPDLAMRRRRNQCDVLISLQEVIVSPAKPCGSRYSLYYLFDVHADHFLRTSLCSSTSPLSGAGYWVALAGRLYWHDRWLRGIAPEADRCLRWFKAVFNGIPRSRYDLLVAVYGLSRLIEILYIQYGGTNEQ